MCPCVVSFLPLLPLPPLTLSTDVAPATKWNVLQLIDCSALRSIPITGTSSLLWLLLTSHSSLLLRLTRPPVRPPQLRCVLFPSMYLPHLLVLPTTFWTSVSFATLSAFPSLICGSCPSGQRFAYSFFQIPPHDGHPCCSTIHFPLSGHVRDLHPLERAHGAQTKKMKDFSPIFHFFHHILTDFFVSVRFCLISAYARFRR